MAEEKTAKSTWLKAIGTSIFGLVSGAVLMYVSPLVNTFVKPSKPLANFSQQPQGLEVTFSNRSTNATQGWWDFGDGSTLEPYNPNQETIKHTYPRPGVYSAKLSLSNFLGDENDRTVSVNLDATQDKSPAIETFKVTPIKADLTAPVTLRVESAVKNAELSIWSAGDVRPLEITHDPSLRQDRLVTYTEPGTYSIRLVAVNGKQTVEKTEQINIAKGNGLHAHVALNVTFEAVRVTRIEKQHHRMITFPPDLKENTYSFKKEFHPLPGNVIAEASFVKLPSDPAVKNVKLDIAADRSKVFVSGELIKTAGRMGKNTPLPSWHAELMIVEEAPTATETKKCDPVMVTLNLPTGSEKAVTHVPLPVLPDKWIVKDRHLSLKVRDHKQVVWTDTKLPATANMQMRNKTWHVNVVESNGNIRLEVQESPARIEAN